MIATVRRSAAVAAVLIAVACGEKKEAPPASPAASPAPTPAQPAPPAAAISPSTPTASPTAASNSTPTASPASPAAQPAPPAATAPAAPAPAPAASHAKVGPEKCKMCHRLQFDSWAASLHKAKGLDCEGCHGDGGDYWSAAVMRDRAKATAAGLVIPDLSACRKCHGAKADAALYAKVHAHKAK